MKKLVGVFGSKKGAKKRGMYYASLGYKYKVVKGKDYSGTVYRVYKLGRKKLGQVYSLYDGKGNFFGASRDLGWLKEQKRRLDKKFRERFKIKKGYKQKR